MTPLAHGTAAAGRAGDEAARRSLQRRVLAVVAAAQVLGGAGLAAGVTVGALLARQMLGSDALSGLPPPCSRSGPRRRRCWWAG